jgi:competence protein ComEC
MQISHGSASVLLAGDVSGKVEKELLTLAPPLQSQVLNVAHHGSKSSSGAEFLDHVAPRVALISAEYNGPWNLPSPEVLDRLHAAGAQVFRTDRDGAITVEMMGWSLRVRRYGALAGDSTAGGAVSASMGDVTWNVR